MNQFRVECSEVNYFTVVVEAETEDKARERDHSEDIRVTVRKFEDHKFDYKYLRMLERR